MKIVMLVCVKEYIIKNFATFKSHCNVQELYSAFKKTSKCKYWVLKVLCVETQMVCSVWLKNDSLCLHLQCSSKSCVASRCNGLGLDLIKKIVCNTESNKWIMRRCESCPGIATLKEFLD